MALEAVETERLRTFLSRDHQRLETLFTHLLEEFAEGHREGVREMWTRFDAGLTGHIKAEEKYLLPHFQEVEPAAAAALRADHDSFRRTLAELGLGVDLAMVSLDVAEEFVRGLREHACKENDLLYRWAQREIGEEGQLRIERELGGGQAERR